MSVNPEFETYTYAGKIAACKAQSVVECRLSGVGELGNVLAVKATATLSSAEAGDGEVKYGGKVFFCVVYEDAERNICRMERGAEFSHRATEEHVTPACAVEVTLHVLSAAVRREGASAYATCVIEAEIRVNGARSVRYLTGGEDVICRKENIPVFKEEYFSGDFEVNDEFETDFVGDVLMHGESVALQRISAEAGSVVFSGEVAVNICALKKDGPENYERLLPFRAELPCDGASVGSYCDGKVAVQSAAVSLSADEEGGKSKLSISLSLSVRGMVYIKEQLFAATDAFLPRNKAQLTAEKVLGEYREEGVRFTERIGGIAALSAPIDYTCSLQALVLQQVEAECVMNGESEEVQGVASATLIVTERDGAHRGVNVQLPFAVRFECEKKGRREVSLLLCGMSVRQKREGEAEAEATLKIAVDVYGSEENAVVSDVIVGEELPVKNCAFSVFLPGEGDGLWEIAKTLRKEPDAVAADNPGLSFPVKKGERIIVYRRR